MAADGCVVNVGVVLSVLFVAVGAVLDESLDAVVGPVLDRESHQRVAVAPELLVKHVEAGLAIAAVEEAQDEHVVLHHGVVNRQERPLLYHKDIG